MKELTNKQIANIKRVFQNNLPYYKRLETIKTKIESLQEEAKSLFEVIEGNEVGVKRITDGLTSGQLIKCEYVPQFNEDGTPKMDKEGKYQQKKRVLKFEYPVENPSTTDPTDNMEPVDSAYTGSDNDIDNNINNFNKEI